MISYAQNFEDVLLNRLFKEKKSGFYIDVGAAHPSIFSVTKYFYDLGWRGINIEPIPEFYNLLKKERDRDINLNIALGAKNEVLEFYEADFLEASSLNSTIVERANAADSATHSHELKRYMTEVRTLADICHQFCTLPIDFLKIDVEGFEKEVLLGADFTKYQPLLVVVEATKPNSGINPFQVFDHLTTNDWEYILTDAGYCRVYFDGLNCFYLHEKDKDLHAAFSIPVNPYEFNIAEYEIDEKFENSFEALPKLHIGHVANYKAYAHAEKLKSKLDIVEAKLQTERADHGKTRELLSAEKDTHAETRDLLAAEKNTHAETRDLLAAEKNSHSKLKDLHENERFKFNRRIDDLNQKQGNLIAKCEELHQSLLIEANNHRGLAISMHAWDATMRRRLRSRFFAPRLVLPQIPDTASTQVDISEFRPILKISVITPSFNSAHTIERAIQSVMKQDYHHWEHIIIDGGSTDGTIEILNKYKHVRWISEPDRGQIDAMNKGFAMSSGELIVYLNSDDYFNEGAFSAAVEAFSSETMMVVGKVKVYDEVNDSWWINNPRIDFDSILHHWEPDAFCVNPVGYFYRRQVQEKIPFKEENGGKMDLAFLMEAALHYGTQTIKIDHVLGCFMNKIGTCTVTEQSTPGYWSPQNFSFIEPLLRIQSESFQIEFRKKQQAGYAQRERWIAENNKKNSGHSNTES